MSTPESLKFKEEKTMTRKQILTRKLLRLQARAKKLDEKAKVSTDEKELAEITE